MKQQKGINRRDFLKISGMSITAGVLGAPQINDLITDQNANAANDAGGFFIRTHDPENPPYEIDETLYQRKPGSDTAFGRHPDKTLERNVNTQKNLESGEVGDDWLAYAYAAGAATYMFDNSMYSWDKVAVNPSQLPEGRWVPQEHGYTVEDATKIIKRTAKLYGASLAGIAPVNELWFYKDAADMSPADLVATIGGGNMSMPESGKPPAMNQMDPEMIQQMLPQILESMEPEEFKEMLLSMLENVDPATLPIPLAMLKKMPAESLQERFPEMMENMDPSMMSGMMENMDPSLLPMPSMPDMDPSAMPDMTAMIDSMSKDILFSEEIDTPIIDDDAKIIPRSMNRVIVMAFEMDEGGMNTGGNSHIVSQLGEAAAMDGYSRMAFTSSRLANFIRRLGYNAIPMGNDHSLSIPMAVDAGLGELGRNGVLITPRYGPRVRLAKVMTDMPLIADKPISFGVTEFCEICGKCADQCPSSAIPEGERTFDAPPAGIPGLLNWPVDGDKCFAYWAEVGGSCYNCIRVCPFNKPEGWLHDATRILIGVRSGTLDQIMLKLDDASGYGAEKGTPPEDFWDIDTYVHIKD